MIWHLVRWTDENMNVVDQMICHESELILCLNLPFPPGAVCREKTEILKGNSKFGVGYFRRSPIQPGDTFEEEINQGLRPCVVLAVDVTTGEFLYEYQMPHGTTSLRIGGWKQGKSYFKRTGYPKLSRRWKQLLADSTVEMIGNHQ